MRDRISRPPSRCALTMGGVQFFGYRQHAQQRLPDNQQEDNLRQSEASPTEEVCHGDKRDEQAQEAGDVAVPDFNPGFFQIVRAVRVVGGGGRAVGDPQQLAVTPRPIGDNPDRHPTDEQKRPPRTTMKVRGAAAINSLETVNFSTLFFRF